MRYILFLFVVITSAAGAQSRSSVHQKDLSHFSGASDMTADARELDQCCFSGTQKWEPKYLAFTRKKPLYLPEDWKDRIMIPEPPRNSSVRTKAEIAYLTTLISERNDARGAIEAEVSNLNLKWGKYTYKNLTEGKKYPQTSKLILATYNELAIVCFVCKKKYNRVRPSILGEKIGVKLETVVKVPNHPAYPSGHSVGAYTLAYLLQELEPESTEQFRKDAARIAHNREIGGLHYPSDSEAGKVVARQIADFLLENEAYLKLLEAARSEWK